MRLLFIEDDPFDLELTLGELRRFGFEFEYERVETLEALRTRLGREAWSAVISDYSLPGFTGEDALRVVREHDRELPFIVLSGNLGEERAVDIIRAGANDYVMKDRMARLCTALERELRDVQLRQEHRGLFTAWRRSEDRYRRIFETVPIGVAVTTPYGRILTANGRLANILGCVRESLPGRTIDELSADGIDIPDREAEFEQTLVRGDGRIVLASITVAPVHSDAHELEQLVWIVEDVTAQHESEQSLRSYRQQLDEAQRMARIGSYEYDFETGRRLWSDELYRIHGLDPASPPNIALIDGRIHPDDVARVRAQRETMHQSMQPYFDEHRIVLPSGEVRTLTERSRFIRDKSGHPVKIVGVTQDITEARLQDDELQRRTVQQVVLANLGQGALGGEPIDALLGQVAEIVTRLLDVELCSILQSVDGGFRIVGGIGWSEDVAPGVELTSDDVTVATYTVQTNAPVVVDSVLDETRFAPAPFLLRHDVASGLTVPISTARVAVWGVLGAHTRTPREFSMSDVDFLRSVATVLAQAVERDRVDQQLVLHAAQQSAVAELSRIALKSVDDAIVVACAIAAEVLDIDHSLFFEIDHDARMLRYQPLHAWSPDAPRAIPLQSATPLAMAVYENAPVLIDASEAMPAGIAIPVASAMERFGILTAHCLRPRRFNDSDVEFLQSLANILADAMERERARRALAASEERYREVVEGASEIIFTLSTEGVMTSLNAAFTTITGLPVHEWIGRPFTDLLDPEDAVRELAKFHTLVEGQCATNTEAHIAATGRTVVLEIAAFPKIENGSVTAVYGFGRDVTNARRVEEERQGLTRNLQLLLESTVEGIVTVDIDGRCTMTNRAAAAFLGWSQEEMIGRRLQMLLHGGNTAAANEILDVARTGLVREVVNGTFVRADGSPIPVDYSVAPIIDAGVRVGVVISFSDVTERRKLEAKLEQADRLTSLGRLAATIAHEFNNVLMGISPFVEVLRRGRNVETSLDHIGRAVKRGKRITQDILRFTQPAQPVRAAFDVAPWVDNITLEAQSLLPSHVRIVTRIDPTLRIDGDANQLQQIFTNLILNARDAMPEGGTLTLEARREPPHAKLPFGVVERPERFAHFVVRDTGHGMTAETLRHIFEPLFTTKKNGTGLGLPVTHQVVQRHGGDIFVESAVGQGTTFHIFLPLAEQTETRVAEVIEQIAAFPDARRVLLVEDDESVATGLVTLLEMEGLEIEVVGTGAEAVRYIEQHVPDVVVLDVGLPDMDGTAVYTAIAERRPELPVIFSTGHADKARLDQFVERQNVAYLLKPYDGVTLLGAIRDVMTAH